LIKIFKSNGGLACSLLIYRAPFIVEHLLYPKTSCGTVQQAEQGKMLVFGGSVRQLDNRGCSVKHLPTTVENKVVVCSHFSIGNGEWSKCPLSDKLHILKPFKAMFLGAFAEHVSTAKGSTKSP